jgi:uncharacterized membrane protein
MPEEKAAAKPAASGSDDNLIGALCYVPLFLLSVLVPLFILLTEKKSNKTLAFHAWQALLLTVALFVVFGAIFAVQLVLTVVSSGIGAILSCITLPLGLVVFVAMCFVAFKVYQGEKFMVPVIGEFAMKQVK